MPPLTGLEGFLRLAHFCRLSRFARSEALARFEQFAPKPAASIGEGEAGKPSDVSTHASIGGWTACRHIPQRYSRASSRYEDCLQSALSRRSGGRDAGHLAAIPQPPWRGNGKLCD